MPDFPVPQAQDPRNYMLRPVKDDRFLEAYVESDYMMADFFDFMTGTALTSDDPPRRVNVPGMRMILNIQGANALKGYLKIGAADKNNLLSNYSEERVMRLCRLKTEQIMRHLIIKADDYALDIVSDMTLVLDACFSVYESSLRRAIGRHGADDVSKVSSESTVRNEYSGGVNMGGQQGQGQQGQKIRQWWQPWTWV